MIFKKPEILENKFIAVKDYTGVVDSETKKKQLRLNVQFKMKLVIFMEW